MDTRTYSYVREYEDVNAPAFPNSRFVRITKFNADMLFVLIQMIEALDKEKEIRYDDLKEIVEQKWLEDEPHVPLDVYPVVFEKAYEHALDFHAIREEIRNIAGVETKYVVLNKLPFFEDFKQTLRLFLFILNCILEKVVLKRTRMRMVLISAMKLVMIMDQVKVIMILNVRK
ncbi:MAG: hypothetical protein JHC30_08330 [Caldisericum sp.]|jgi:hypothetical protein|nr:hypothetical protein [Caldisericum sp.]